MKRKWNLKSSTIGVIFLEYIAMKKTRDLVKTWNIRENIGYVTSLKRESIRTEQERALNERDFHPENRIIPI